MYQVKIKLKAFYSVGESLDVEGIVEIDTNARTIRGVIIELAEQYGKKFRNEILLSNGIEIKPGLGILVNGKDYRNMKDRLDSPISHKDILAIFPPIHNRS